MIITQKYDLRGHVSGYEVSEAAPIEEFSTHILDFSDSMEGDLLVWDSDARIATITADNGTWRYKMLADSPRHGVYTGTLIGKELR